MKLSIYGKNKRKTRVLREKYRKEVKVTWKKKIRQRREEKVNGMSKETKRGRKLSGDVKEGKSH